MSSRRLRAFRCAHPLTLCPNDMATLTESMQMVGNRASSTTRAPRSSFLTCLGSLRALHMARGAVGK